MRFLLRNVVLGASLLTLCSTSFSASARNPYDQELEQLHSDWSSADRLHKLVLVDRIFRLRDYVDDTTAVSAMLAEIARSASPDDGLIRAEAEACLNEIAALEGEAPKNSTKHWYEQAEQRSQVLAEAEKNGSRADALELLAQLEHIAGLHEASEHMQQAAQLAPTTARWEEAAAFTDDSLRKFSALQSGLAVDGNHARIRLQLAVYYIGRQQLEKAQLLLQKARAEAPDDFVVGERLAGLYLNLGLRSVALQQLKALETRAQAIPLWLQARLAIDYEQVGLLEEAARLAGSVIQKKSTDREQLQLLARFHQRRHMLHELEGDYTALLRLQPDSPELWDSLAQVESGTGDLPQAKDALLRVIALEPRNADAHRQLAQIYNQLHQPQAANHEMAAAAELLRKENGSADPDSALLVNAQKLAADAFQHPLRENDVALADVRIQELYKNGLSRTHVQQIFYVGSEAAVSSHRLATIRYSPGSEAVRVLHARIWKANGSVIDAQEDGEAPVGDAAIAMYYDMRSRRLRFSGLEKGDVTELEYSLSPTLAGSPYPGYYGELVTLAGNVPARLKRYALEYPATQQIFVHAEKVPNPATTEQNGMRTLVWELHDIPALPREPHSPGITEVSPYVHLSTMADWQALGSWYSKLIRPQFDLDRSLSEELDRLLQGRHSEPEKITAIQEFVLRSTHYVALEFGIYSYKPYPVTQTYARRFGDCKDKASLMIALLRAAGIDAEIALIRTRSLGDVAPTPASMALFDHAIVYVPKYSLWLDGTAEYAGSELPLEDQGALALTVSLNGQAELRQVPTSTAADNYTKRTIHAELTRQGVIHFNGSAVTRGEDAPVLRRELAVRERQLDLFRQRLAEVFPRVEVESVAVHGMEQAGSDVSVDFEGALNALQNNSLVTLGSSWMRRAYVSTLAPTSTRTQDLVLGSPWITEEEIHVALPPRATVEHLPQDQEVRTGFGSVRLHYSKSAHEIVIRSRLEIEKTRINPQEYPAFRQFCSTVERSFHNEIVVGLAR